MTVEQATIGAFFVGALALCGAFARWVWPLIAGFFKALNTTFETINGKPAVMDRANREVEPAEPSLRVQLNDIKVTVSDQAAQNDRLASLEGRVDRLEDGSQLERLMARHESTSAFNAIEAIANHTEEEVTP